MSRARSGVVRKRRVKSVLKKTKGFRGRRGKLYRIAKNAMMKALQYSYIGRKLKKRDFRALWIARINAACKKEGINYSRFIFGLKKANIIINRKELSNLAITDQNSFNKLVEIAKKALA